MPTRRVALTSSTFCGPRRESLACESSTTIWWRRFGPRSWQTSTWLRQSRADWLDIDGFRFSTESGSEELPSDPRITAYLESKAGEEISIEALKEDRMEAVRASTGQPQETWPVYRCVVYEAEVDGELFVLTAGDWFRVGLDFKERVYADVRRLPPLDGLPDADRETDEASYNAKAAQAIDGLCLDRKLVMDGGPDKMEVCDVLTREKGVSSMSSNGEVHQRS